MPQYWLKPIGTTKPHDPIDNAWTPEGGFSRMKLITGPPNRTHRQFLGDRVLFHAVILGHVFAEGEIVAKARWDDDPVPNPRFPWVYRCRIDVSVPLVTDGPKTSEVVSKTAIGRLQRGGDFAKLTQLDYEAAVAALRQCPSARHHAASI